jgi:hypothetical protein
MIRTGASQATSNSCGCRQMIFTLLGDDESDEFLCPHGWGTLNVTHEIYNAANDTVMAEFKRVSPESVKVTLGKPLAIGNDLKLIIRSQKEN